MRLIDADAEISRIENEIHRIDGKIERLKKLVAKEPFNTFHKFEKELEQCYKNKTDCKTEIATLKNYQTAYDVENPWILCSKKLPEEPEEIPTEDEPVEEMMIDGKFKEYIVAIWGADESTTLYYIGNNEWYDGINGTYYKVIAWQPMPEVYKGLDR